MFTDPVYKREEFGVVEKSLNAATRNRVNDVQIVTGATRVLALNRRPGRKGLIISNNGTVVISVYVGRHLDPTFTIAPTYTQNLVVGRDNVIEEEIYISSATAGLASLTETY